VGLAAVVQDGEKSACSRNHLPDRISPDYTGAQWMRIKGLSGLKAPHSRWIGTSGLPQHSKCCATQKQSPAAVLPKSTGLNDVGQLIRLRVVPHQMRILFPTVIVNFVSLEILGVLNQQLDWVRVVFRRP
jgi:hypothetical protein